MFDNIKAIFLDSEGTLIDANRHMKDESIDAINALTRKGIHVVLTSGLPRFILRNKQKKSHASHYIIANNGSDIYDLKKNNSIYVSYLNKDFIYELWKEYQNKFNIILGVGDTEYASGENIYTKNPILIDNQNIHHDFFQCHVSQKPISKNDNVYDEISSLRHNKDLNIENYLTIDIFNMLFKYNGALTDNEIEILIRFSRFLELEKLQSIIKNNYQNVVSIANQSADFTKFCTIGEIPWFTLNNVGVSKGNGIEHLSDYLGIPIENRMAIGNDYNDISMVDKVKTFMCPSDSCQQLIDKSSYIYDEIAGIDKVLRKVLVSNEKHYR